MKRVLVTGADGQLGQCLQKISEDFPDVQFKFYNSKSLDITDTQKVSMVFSKGNFTHCVNCAAYTNVEQAEKTPEPAFAINAEAVRLLAEQCRQYQVTLLHVSTDYVFDGTKESGYVPEDKTNPINAYGKSKLQGERYIQGLLERYFIVRTSWLYSGFGTNFYKTILRKAKAGEDLQITDEQTGCPTNANNLAKYLLELISKEHSNYGVHHFTDGEAMTWYSFAQQILRENNLEEKVRLDKARNYRTFAKRPKNSCLK